jgi:hypothetical protein
VSYAIDPPERVLACTIKIYFDAYAYKPTMFIGGVQFWRFLASSEEDAIRGRVY